MDEFKKCELNCVDGDREGKDWRLPVKSVSRIKSAETALGFSRREWTPPVRDQGHLGACVGFSGTAVLGEKEIHRGKVFSPLFLYKKAQEFDEWFGENYSGTSISGACQVLRKLGVCLEEYYPYTGSPSEGMMENALEHVVKSYYRVDYDEELLKSLLLNGCLWCSFDVRDNFYEARDMGGWVPEQGYLKGQSHGGHAVVLTGWRYRNEIIYWEFMNSWSKYWGDNGFGYIPGRLLKEILIGGVYYVLTDAAESDKIAEEKKITFWDKLKVLLQEILLKLQGAIFSIKKKISR